MGKLCIMLGSSEISRYDVVFAQALMESTNIPRVLTEQDKKGGEKKTVLGILLNSEQNDNYIFYNFLYFVSDTVNKMKFLSRHVYIKTHNDYILLLKHHGFAVPQQTP